MGDRVLGAQLDEAVRSQNGIFYYRTNYDARLLYLKPLIENRKRGKTEVISDQPLKNDFLEKLKNFDLATMINEEMPKRRLGWLMKKGMFVVPAEDSWDKRKGKHPRKTKRPRGLHGFNNVIVRAEEAQIRRLRDLGAIDEFDYEERLDELRMQEREAGIGAKRPKTVTPVDSDCPGYNEKIHATQIGEVLYVNPYDYSVHVEWTSTNTCDENLMKGPGEPVKRGEMKKINKPNTKAYRYEMGVQHLFHVKLAHNFMPEMEPKSESPVPEKCPDLKF